MNLYKFQTVNGNSLSALLAQSLYFANAVQMNDPTENMFRLLEPNEADKYAPDLTCIGDVGILSMAIGDNQEIEKSPFMWAHYGNCLKGFCLVFDFQSFVSSLDDSTRKHGKVAYIKYPRLLAGDNLLNENSGLEEVAGVNFKHRNLLSVYESFLDKPAEFENEREYRFLSDENGLKQYSAESLISVIIGERMSKNDKELLLVILEHLNIKHKLKIARAKENSFTIEVSS